MPENINQPPNLQFPASSTPGDPLPAKEPPATSPVIVGGPGTPLHGNGTRPGWLARLRQMFAGSHNLLWVAMGTTAILVIGGISIFAASHYGDRAKKDTVAQTDAEKSEDGQQSSNQDAVVEDKPGTPDTNSQQNGSNTGTTSGSPVKNNNSGGSTGGGATGGGGTSGSGTGGGGGSNVPNPLKIMPLGDSLTQGGVNANLGGGQPDPTTINGYRLELKNLLVAAGYTIDYVGSWQLGDSQLSDKDLNGFSGACIMVSPCGGGTLYPQTAAWINSEQPDLVIMQGGENDFGSDPGLTEAQNAANMESWIQLVWNTKADIKIIVTGVPWHSGYDDLVHDYVDSLQAQGKPIRWVPYGSDIGRIDGTHPNAAGYITWANELAPMVEELYPL